MISITANNNTADYVNYQMWQKIESCMLMRKYSLEDLASEIGVSLEQMQRYKQGLDEIGITKLCAIAKILSVSVTFLLFELGVTYPGTYKIWQEVERYSLKQGYTREDLANELGMSEQQMQMYAQGLASFTVKELYAIAKMLSVHFLDLISLSELEDTWNDLEEESLVLQQRIRDYEQGESEITIRELYNIARVLSVDVKDLLSAYCYKGKDSENERLSLMERFKSQESWDELSALIESLAKMLVDKAEVKKAEEIRIAKVLAKKGVSVDVISQAAGLSTEEFA